MGYFSNGCEGHDYEDRWCSRCIHRGSDDGPSCPVWFAHLDLNYEECNNKKSILHILIPRTKDGLGNEQCRMFIEGDPPEPTPTLPEKVLPCMVQWVQKNH